MAPPVSPEPDLNQLVVRCLDALEESGPAGRRGHLRGAPRAGRARARPPGARPRPGLVGDRATTTARVPRAPGRLPPPRAPRRRRHGRRLPRRAGARWAARVALKLIRPDQLYFEGARERFQREVEAVARLAAPRHRAGARRRRGGGRALLRDGAHARASRSTDVLERPGGRAPQRPRRPRPRTETLQRTCPSQNVAGRAITLFPAPGRTSACGSRARSPRRSSTPTSAACCTATSSPPT